ncbi:MULTISPECIES: hypothetical protein [Corallococcus]|uniref:hypothetical protein n=1 Tax=Corallococcus TaxID=83461 RepID=UPI00117FEC07|nr:MULTISPECIES: hypothetical protein [Corallococcus]NBD11452.1 hypothetical protein [Corallococcus silvisoli]TSC32348.1 hypothetical protein FOF48_09910 [Corallococcus sp. Z5C101001]
MRPELRALSRWMLLTTLMASLPAAAGRIQLSEEAILNVDVLLQPQMQLIKDGAPTGGVGTDFFLRRVRLLIFGSITKRLTFFIDTDQPNFGKNGDWSPAFYIQDATVAYEVANKTWVEAGFILAPLSHQTLQGAIALNTVDYHSDLIRFPVGVGKVWRDMGVQVRGFAGPLMYRAAILNGVEGAKLENGQVVNPDDLPRFVGHARYNVLGREEDLFLRGIYFADHPLLSFGVGADYQFSAIATASGVHDALALAADVFLDLPVGTDQEFVFQSNVYSWQQGHDNVRSGTGFFVELGYRIGIIEPILSGEYFHGRVAAQDLLTVRPGFNVWFQKHTFNLKTEVAVSRVGEIAHARTGITGTAQLQLFY